MDKTSIGDRMRQYEATTKSVLLLRTPVIIRVDGKAFHSWTKSLWGVDPSLREGPYSDVMHLAMVTSMTYAMREMQNVQFAYTQSDEISFLLKDWTSHDTQQWFGGGLQKISSVTASLVTAGFNQYLYHNNPVLLVDRRWAAFDARVFQLPKEEVTNYFIWRQQDATRNSINMLGQYHFSHNHLLKKSTNEVQDLLMLEKNINWNDLATWKKRGTGTFRSTTNEKTEFYVDEQLPIFTKNRDYIERFL